MANAPSMVIWVSGKAKFYPTGYYVASRRVSAKMTSDDHRILKNRVGSSAEIGIKTSNEGT